MTKYYFYLLSILFIFSCHKASENHDSSKFHDLSGLISYDEESIAPPMTSEPPAPPSFSLEKGSKIIKRGNMDIKVEKLELAKQRVDSILKYSNGYYENEQYISYGNSISYELIVSIPNTKFDSLIYQMQNGIGELLSKNITAKDVTEEYVDLNIRLENNLAYLNQYKQILKKAKSVKEILEVQEKIRNIEEEIENKKGRLKFLDDKVLFSTLSLDLTQQIEVKAKRSNFSERISKAFKNGGSSFLSFIVGLVNLWPFILLIIILLFVRKPLWNKIRGKKE